MRLSAPEKMQEGEDTDVATANAAPKSVTDQKVQTDQKQTASKNKFIFLGFKVNRDMPPSQIELKISPSRFGEEHTKIVTVENKSTDVTETRWTLIPTPILYQIYVDEKAESTHEVAKFIPALNKENKRRFAEIVYLFESAIKSGKINNIIVYVPVLFPGPVNSGKLLMSLEDVDRTMSSIDTIVKSLVTQLEGIAKSSINIGEIAELKIWNEVPGGIINTNPTLTQPSIPIPIPNPLPYHNPTSLQGEMRIQSAQFTLHNALAAATSQLAAIGFNGTTTDAIMSQEHVPEQRDILPKPSNKLDSATGKEETKPVTVIDLLRSSENLKTDKSPTTKTRKRTLITEPSHGEMSPLLLPPPTSQIQLQADKKTTEREFEVSALRVRDNSIKLTLFVKQKKHARDEKDEKQVSSTEGPAEKRPRLSHTL